MGRYEPVTEALRVAASRGQGTVEYSFEQLEEIVGQPLPASAGVRQWWANSSQVQSLAWRAAGYHVDQVYLDRRRVRFALGERGGSYADRGGVPASAAVRGSLARVERAPVGPRVDVRVQVQWLDAGRVELDWSRKPVFGRLEEAPGLYRLTLWGRNAERARVYIGESDNLRRRLSGNYRNPGAGQQTSLRINALLREHLEAGGTISLAVALSATVCLNGVERPLDLRRKAARLLAENAALVLAHVTDDADIVNLG